MNRSDEIIKAFKIHIGEGVEAALEYLEQVLAPDSDRYNDYIQIKSRYNSLQRELLLGVLDHSTYDISRNNISKALLLLAEEITEKDLLPEGGAKTEVEDKHGEILYHVPDLMQIDHEEKCTVRIAFEEELLKREWEESPEDVTKGIRVSEIMAVSMLNVDENDPPFTIRSFSETVQFLDKDDFTEWVFYVKPVKLGRFPLILRVSVIEMINNKEYKKDIVLEEEITVQTEEVPEHGGVQFKAAATSLALGIALLPPEESTPPAAQVQEAGKKGLQRVAGALLTAAALAASGYFGFQYYTQEQDWGKAKGSSDAADYEEYLEKHPDGRHSDEARSILDSLNARMDSIPEFSSAEEEIDVLPDTIMQENNTESASPGNQPDISNPTRPKQKTKRPTQTNTGRQPETTQPGASKSSEGTNETPAPPKPEALLRGDNFYFKIPRFTIVESRVEDMFFTFYKFNQYREILVVLGSQGEAEMTPGEKISVVPENGAEITAEVKYVSKTPQVEDRYDWYFTIPPAGLERLANEKFKGVRLQYANGRPKRTYNFTNRGSKDLKRKANEALKKLDDQ